MLCCVHPLHTWLCTVDIITRFHSYDLERWSVLLPAKWDTGEKKKGGFIFNNNPPAPHPPTHFAVLNVSGIPVHGHNGGSGALNIEGNSIGPCSSDRTYGCTTCSSRATCLINLLRIIFYWNMDFLSWCALVSQTVLTVLLDVRASVPSCWGPW